MHQRPLQTTITGSLPKPAWLAEPEKLWSPWKLEGDALIAGQRDAVRLVLRDQERAGIDIVGGCRAGSWCGLSSLWGCFVGTHTGRCFGGCNATGQVARRGAQHCARHERVWAWLRYDDWRSR